MNREDVIRMAREAWGEGGVYRFDSPKHWPEVEEMFVRFAALVAAAERERISPQEPVAWFCELPDNKISIKIVGKPTEGNWKPLYTAPTQREWQGLTDDEIEGAYKAVYGSEPSMSVCRFADELEAKLKEKNT